MGPSQGVINADKLVHGPNRIYISMEIEFDPRKDDANVARHGISLARAVDMEILTFERDERFEYGEVRYRAWGLIEDEYFCLAFVVRSERLRAISLRRAHKKEFFANVPQKDN